MSIEAIAAAASGAAGVPGAVQVTELGPVGGGNADAAGAAKFQASMDKAGMAPVSGTDVPPAIQGLFKSLDAINAKAGSVSDYAAKAEATGGEMTPGEIVQLTMQCQQFMFECQLTSNIANRSSDGVQQLFKQQG